MRSIASIEHTRHIDNGRFGQPITAEHFFGGIQNAFGGQRFFVSSRLLPLGVRCPTRPSVGIIQIPSRRATGVPA